MAFWSKFKKNPIEDDPLLKQEPGMSSAPESEAGATPAHAPEPGFGYSEPPNNAAPAAPVAAPQQPVPTPQPPAQAAPPITPEPEVAEPPFMAHRERPVPAFTRRAMEKTTPRAQNPLKQPAYSAPSEQIANADLEYKHLRRIRARRRFIGAAMLLALVLVGLPFIFDKEPPPPDQNVPLAIPNQDAALMAIRGSSPQTMEETGKEIAQEEPEMEAEPPQKATEPTPSKATEHPAKETKPEPAKPPQAKEPPPETQQAKQEPTPETRTTPRGQFFIQLVATRDLKKAEELRKKMADAKIPCYLEKVAVKGGTAWRVRVGPFTTEKSAEEARGLVGLQGYTAKVQRAS